jgi:uncharacterized protein (TIGR02246 family)
LIRSSEKIATETAELSAEDRLEIQQLIARYSFYEDSGQAESYASLFTSDGTFFGGGDKTVTGREALARFARERWETRPQVRKWTHWVSNIVITPTPDGAEAKSYSMVVEKNGNDGNDYKIVKTSGKHDELRREDGSWRFHVRRVFALPAEGPVTERSA